MIGEDVLADGVGAVVGEDAGGCAGEGEGGDVEGFDYLGGVFD